MISSWDALSRVILSHMAKGSSILQGDLTEKSAEAKSPHAMNTHFENTSVRLPRKLGSVCRQNSLKINLSHERFTSFWQTIHCYVLHCFFIPCKWNKPCIEWNEDVPVTSPQTSCVHTKLAWHCTHTLIPSPLTRLMCIAWNLYFLDQCMQHSTGKLPHNEPRLGMVLSNMRGT